ncbi:DUF7344 domain-containing protein [Haloterrigena alkaliphila]|uniref:DUF7344 domain-containing protein n=1 Tax=Haloterrigena alkaliphila TaxID=2816475 RepID=A0A8A2VEP0_9EURY|nr:hypothetical protein [Haloterrigena alkaliphila]QSW98884.1 hypothetical protein J0X25_16085 [Haloterrigena alkaliphila]
MESADLSLDAAYGLLSESRRRYVLYYFLDNDHANIERLAIQIAAWESNTRIDDVTEEQTQRVTTSLLHSHIPELADNGIVEYDGRTGDVIVDDEFDEIRETAAQARATEDDIPITGSSRESFLYSEPLPSSKTEHQ